MTFLSLLESKRDGQALSAAQIREIVAAYTQGQIPDYQMSAFLMAVYFRGLNTKETRALTLAMRDSGERLSWPADPRPLVDKHSTGGIGDKVSLILAPLLACLGFRVPMISGRGLGITGGTLDKLESIPGFQTTLPASRIREIVQEIGCVICGQTESMVPADKGLYALRDVTGTVPSIPLIVASILSKKLAEGIEALVLDVKFGSGTFMVERAQAQALANVMVDLGNQCGVRTRALITRMDAPLGRAAGNWLEVAEGVKCLTPGEAEGSADLLELVTACAATLLLETQRAASPAEARAQVEQCLASGEPRKKWDAMLAAQGADLEAFARKLKGEDSAPVVAEFRTPRTGHILRCNAKRVGEIVRDLGGGRFTRGSGIDHAVGVDRMLKPGEPVTAGAVVARVHARTPAQAEAALARLRSAYAVSEDPVAAADAPLSIIAEML